MFFGTVQALALNRMGGPSNRRPREDIAKAHATATVHALISLIWPLAARL